MVIKGTTDWSESTERSQHPENFAQRITSCRWTLAFMLFFLRMCQTSLRQSIGMALVCMTERPTTGTALPGPRFSWNSSDPLDSYNVSSGNEVTLLVRLVNGSTNYQEQPTPHREFVWGSTFEGVVLSSYYYGYLLTPLLSGYMERSVGAKRLVATCIGLGATVNLVTPFATRQHRYLLIALRVLAGTTNGMIDPAVQSLWAVWAPRPEVAYLTAVEYAGVSMGGIFTFLISGLLCQIPLDNGWPLIFYFYGTMSMLWVFVWLSVIFNSPRQHPRISRHELNYITSETQTSAAVAQDTKRKMHPPWGKILCSAPVWAIVVASATFMWVYSWILCYLPTYMDDVLHFNMAHNAVFSSLPFCGKFISGLLCGYLADKLLRTRLSVEFNRKMFQLLGCVGCAVCMSLTGLLDHRARGWAVGLLVSAVTLQNITTVAFRINALDIAPRYSSFILGLSSTVSVACSLTAPLITSAIVADKTHEQWQIMFFMNASLCLVGGFTFLLLGKAEIQTWAADDFSHEAASISLGNPKSSENSKTLSLALADTDSFLVHQEKAGCTQNGTFTPQDRLLDDTANHTLSESREPSNVA